MTGFGGGYDLFEGGSYSRRNKRKKGRFWIVGAICFVIIVLAVILIANM
jgi:type IV secretory pathway component VirB8